MARKPPVHTVPHGDGWANRREGSFRVAKTFARKADAQAAGGGLHVARRPSTSSTTGTARSGRATVTGTIRTLRRAEARRPARQAGQPSDPCNRAGGG